MDREAAMAAVMLSQLPQVGERTATRILSLNTARGVGLEEFFHLPEAMLREDYRLPASALRRIVQEHDLHRREAEDVLSFMARYGVSVWLASDKGYPERWRQRLDPCPPVAYALGSRQALGSPAVAVLNSRGLNERAVTTTIRVVQAVVAQGFAVVSGGMKATHRVPAVLSRTATARVIVLERGLFAAFGARLDRDPFGLGPGRAALDRSRTLVLSPFRLRDHAVARNGVRRDELVTALADIVVAVHTRPGGQIERICFDALDRGQCVFSWMGGNAGLVAAGAVPIDDGKLGELRRFQELRD
jgi:hypothetical protein